MTRRILDLGCGQKKYPGAIGADRNRKSHADLICDLEGQSYPFRDNTFDLVVCDNLMEHLSDIPSALREIHRILKPGGEVVIIVPHFSSDDSYADVTHKHHLSVRALDAFMPGISAFDYYVSFKFELIERRIIFGNLKRLLGIQWFANARYRFYETHLAFLFQAHRIKWRLKTIKP